MIPYAGEQTEPLILVGLAHEQNQGYLQEIDMYTIGIKEPDNGIS